MGLIPFPAQVPWTDLARVKSQEAPPTQTFLQYLSSLDGVVRVIGSQGGSPRIVLSAATSFFYKPSTGNDINDGSAGNPWASPAPLFSRYDFGNQNVTLNLQENTTARALIQPWSGGGNLIHDLGGHTITYTSGAADDAAIYFPGGNNPGSYTVQNGAIGSSGAGAGGIRSLAGGLFIIGTGITFNACGFFQISGLGGGCRFSMPNNFTVSGGGAGLFLFDAAAFGANAGLNTTITFSTPITYSIQTVRANGAAKVVLFRGDGTSLYANPGNVTGQRFLVDTAATIFTNGSGPNGIPGTIAGVATAPGTYS